MEEMTLDEHFEYLSDITGLTLDQLLTRKQELWHLLEYYGYDLQKIKTVVNNIDEKIHEMCKSHL